MWQSLNLHSLKQKSIEKIEIMNVRGKKYILLPGFRER